MQAVNKIPISQNKVSFSSIAEPMRFYLEEKVLRASLNTRLLRVLNGKYGRDCDYYSYYRKEGEKPVRTAVIRKGQAGASYALGTSNLKLEGGAVNYGKQKYAFYDVESESQADSLLSLADAFSEHASTTIGFAVDQNGKLVMVCQATSGRLSSKPSLMPKGERKSVAQAIIQRLASLHNEGLGCGGLSPEAVEFQNGKAKVANPTKIFALSPDNPDEQFFEAVSTLRSLVSSGYIRKKEAASLAAEYLSFSPICRHPVAEYFGKRGVKGSMPEALANLAVKHAAYF